MYEKIIIGLLLSGYISTSIAFTTPVNSIDAHTAEGVLPTADDTAKPRPTEVLVTRDQGFAGGEQKGSRKQLEHVFSEPVIIAIVLGVMAGIIGIFLLFAVCISKLSKKPSLNVQPSLSHDTEAPLTSVETEHPEQ